MLTRGAIETKRRRDEKGLSQRELGRELKLAGAYIGQVELGIRRPGWKNRQKLHASLGVAPELFEEFLPETPSHG